MPALGLVFIAGFLDVAALLNARAADRAVTAAAIASVIASRMLAQFRVALEAQRAGCRAVLQRFLAPAAWPRSSSRKRWPVGKRRWR
jgi:hypothetical protein